MIYRIKNISNDVSVIIDYQNLQTDRRHAQPTNPTTFIAKKYFYVFYDIIITAQ